MSFAFQTATELAHALRMRLVGSRELLEHLLERIDRYDGAINAVVTLDAERALERAGAADEALVRGEVWGPLHGLPITVKDSFETAGLRTTAGADELAEYVPAVDADAVARLRAAGAIVFAKTNLPTYAMDLQSANALFGRTNNPWDPGRTPGGSSGGAAAALAAGFTPLELGSDIGSSIRNPASHCGVFGHKPSWEIVPSRGHIPGPPGTLSKVDLNVSGPMARSAADLDLALDVLAGPRALEARGWRLELAPPRAERLENLRLASLVHHPGAVCDPAVQAVLDRAIDALEAAGARIDREPRLPVEWDQLQEVYRFLLDATLSAGYPKQVFERLLRAVDAPLDEVPEAYRRTARAVTARHRDWLVADEQRVRMAHDLAGFFEGCDALLLPAFAVPPFPHDDRPLGERVLEVGGRHLGYFDVGLHWAALATALWLPATVAPAGLADGLPIGLQIVGPYLEDRTTIAVAQHVERVLGRLGPPPLAP